MINNLISIFIVLFFFTEGFADTFVNKHTGEGFDGYVVTQKKKMDKTQVRIEGKEPRYINLSDYEIHYNYQGRKNKVIMFSLKDEVTLIAEAEAFEKAVILAADQGPLFIFIELDLPEIRRDLAERISTIISKTDNCRTVAYITEGKFGGVFSAGAIIALACDRVYMNEKSSIGAKTTGLSPNSDTKTAGQAAEATVDSQWLSHCVEIAERNNRPVLLTKAMVDKDVEVIEVEEGGKNLLINRKDKKPTQKLVRTLNKKGSLLTLKAAEAVKYGIADGIAASQNDIFVKLDAVKAREVRDSSILKVRKEIEKVQNKIEQILLSVSTRENSLETLTKQINSLDEEIRRIRGRGYYGSDQEINMRKYVKDYDNLLDQIVGTLHELTVDCERALAIANKYPDLADQAETTKKKLKSVRTELESRESEIHFRSRYRYNY